MSITLQHFQFILSGLMWTCAMAASGALFGAVVGLLVAMGGVSRSRPVRAAVFTYVNLVQSAPLLIILFIAFFGLPILGIEVNAEVAAIASLTLYASAYLGEIWRGSIMAIPTTQWEAAECLAFSPLQRMRHVILPQTVKMSIAPTVNFLVSLVKDTSVLSIIGVAELTRSAQIINNSVYAPLQVYAIVAALYFVVCFFIAGVGSRIEKAYS